MTDFPDYVVVCVPWNGRDAMFPGAQAANCGVCDASVSISASSVKLIDERPELVPVCSACMERAAKEEGDPPAPMLVTPEIRRELQERTGLPMEAIDAAIEDARRLGPEAAARRVREFYERRNDN